MKKYVFFVFFALLMELPSLFGQYATRTPLFEHFTQASCIPCASQNPAFQEHILTQYGKLIAHIAYHTSWPGVDPMNDLNPTDVQARVFYYAVGGVPHMVMDGNRWIGGPAGVTPELVDAELALASPITIKVTVQKELTPWKVHVTIKTVAPVSPGDYRLFVAAIEDNITYASPPGTNGEREFPNVFRKFLSSATGDPISPFPAPGGEQSFTYELSLHPEWDADSISVIAFVQEYSTKEVLNAASSRFHTFDLISLSPAALSLDASETAVMRYRTETVSDSFLPAIVSIEVITQTNWDVTVTYNGKEIHSNDTVMLPNGEAVGEIHIQGNSEPGYAIVKLLFQPIDQSFAPRLLTYLVLQESDVLILHSSQSFGDGKDHTEELRSKVNQRFASAGISALIMPVQEFLTARKAKLLSTPKIIYYPVGWTFPAIPTSLARELQQFLENGGNLFIAGQDVGWDTWDTEGNGNFVTRALYTDYFHAKYRDDGNSSRSLFIPEEQDPIFSLAEPSAIFDFYGGHLYPDHIEPADTNAFVIFRYNDNSSGGIRAEKDGYKVVYLGVGIEQLEEEKSVTILTLTDQWFKGNLSSVEFDAALQENRFIDVKDNLSLHFPAPISGFLRIFNLTGNAVKTIPLQNAQRITIPYFSLSRGFYSYIVLDQTGKIRYRGTFLLP